MLQPQSDEDIKTVVEALRRLDPLLDVLWNPKAYIETPGTFSVLGGGTPPTYAARWQVIRRDKAASLHAERNYTLICNVTELDRSGPLPMMWSRGPYAPIGEWLVEQMRLWDAANSALASRLARVHAAHEQVDALTDDSAVHQEAAEKIYREHGSEYWMGGAQGRASPEAAAALFGGSSPPDSPLNTTETPLPPGRARVAAALAVSTP